MAGDHASPLRVARYGRRRTPVADPGRGDFWTPEGAEGGRSMTTGTAQRRAMSLLVLCSAPGPVRAVGTRHNMLESGALDWNLTVAQALTHGVVLALRRLLQARPDLSPSADLMRALGHYAAASRQSCAGQLATLRELAGVDAPLGFRFSPIRGVALSLVLYGHPDARSAEEQVVLVDAADRRAMLDRLTDLGFGPSPARAPGWRPDADHRWPLLAGRPNATRFSRGNETLAVVHEPWPVLPGEPDVTRLLLDRSKQTSAGGFLFRALSPEDLLLHLCSLGASNGWSRLSLVADIAALIQGHPRLSGRYLYRRANEQGMASALALGLSMVRILYGVRVPGTGPEPRGRAGDDVDRSAVRLIRDLFRGGDGATLRPEVSGGSRRSHATIDKASLDSVSMRRGWKRLAPEWTRCPQNNATRSDPFIEAYLEALAIGPAERVLDLASGAGQPLLDIAGRLSGRSFALATDLVAEMLEAVRCRVANASEAPVAYCVADMGHLPLRDETFTRVSCRLGVMFCGDPQRAVDEALRVLEANGRAVYLVWGDVADNTALMLLHRGLGAALTGVSDPGELTLFRFSEPGSLAQLLRRAGFINVDSRGLVRDTRVPAEQRFWWPMLASTYGLRHDDLPESQRIEIDRHMAQLFRPFRDGEFYRLRIHARLVVGDKPGRTAASGRLDRQVAPGLSPGLGPGTN